MRPWLHHPVKNLHCHPTQTQRICPFQVRPPKICKLMPFLFKVQGYQISSTMKCDSSWRSIFLSTFLNYSQAQMLSHIASVLYPIYLFLDAFLESICSTTVPPNFLFHAFLSWQLWECTQLTTTLAQSQKSCKCDFQYFHSNTVVHFTLFSIHYSSLRQ